MKAVRIQPKSQDGQTYTSANPAPSSAIHLADIPVPEALQPGHLVIRTKATTVIRDNLTWPELYASPPAHMGNDFAGIITQVHPSERDFKPGDEVYGMTHAHRGGTWAEHAVVTSEEANPLHVVR